MSYTAKTNKKGAAVTLTAPTVAELLMALYNDTRGPAARMLAFKAGILAALDAQGIRYERLVALDQLVRVFV